MTARAVLVALGAFMALGLAARAMAAGPLDGAYALTGGGGGTATVNMFMVVLQTDNTVVVVVLDPVDSSWTFGSGTLNVNQQVEGVLFFGDRFEAGQFQVRFQGASVTATITLYEFAVAFGGTKIF